MTEGSPPVPLAPADALSISYISVEKCSKAVLSHQARRASSERDGWDFVSKGVRNCSSWPVIILQAASLGCEEHLCSSCVSELACVLRFELLSFCRVVMSLCVLKVKVKYGAEEEVFGTAVKRLLGMLTSYVGVPGVRSWPQPRFSFLLTCS